MKKIIALLMVFAMAAGMLAGCDGTGNSGSGTETPNVPAEATFSGSGTESAPYQIANAEDLWCMAALINSEKFEKTYKAAYYILTADIDLGGKEWTPIGDGYLDGYYSFPGTFDGNGHTISGLNFTSNENDKTRYFGLFGFVEGTVKNLTIASSTIDCSGKGSANTGTIVGRLQYEGTIENCHVASDVTITGSYTTGGLVGEMAGEMVNCTNAAAVFGTKEVGQTGGLVGMTTGTDRYENSGNITNCTNTGTVHSAGEAGGVAGSMSKGTISDSSNTAAVSGEEAGGIVGTINAAQTNGTVSDYTISNCTNSGAVTASEDAGGIAADAYITTGNVTITNCTNSGTVLGEYMGGILSSCSTSTAYATLTVTNCTNSGLLEIKEADGTALAGGIVASLTGKDGGKFILSENKNSAPIDAGSGRAGGILGTYLGGMSDEGDEVFLNVENCVNDANVSGGAMGIGGIAGDISAIRYPALTLTITDCANSGDLFGRGANVRIGGIVGVIEPHYCTALFTNCTNSGNLSCEEVVITKEEEWFNFSASMGGILGYAGLNGVSVYPEEDCGRGNEIALTFEGCQNTGTITTVNEKVVYYTGEICGLCVVGIEIR